MDALHAALPQVFVSKDIALENRVEIVFDELGLTRNPGLPFHIGDVRFEVLLHRRFGPMRLLHMPV